MPSARSMVGEHARGAWRLGRFWAVDLCLRILTVLGKQSSFGWWMKPTRAFLFKMHTHAFNLKARDNHRLAALFQQKLWQLQREVQTHARSCVACTPVPLLPIAPPCLKMKAPIKRDIPAVALGCDRDITHIHIAHALGAGKYRMLDTASGYFNEKVVGRGLRLSGVPRNDLFVQTKLNPLEFGYDNANNAIRRQLAFLGTTYVDSLLLHEPGPDLKTRVATWRALELWHAKGLVHRIGVANFGVRLLTEMLTFCIIKPAFVQVELHPLCWATQAHLVDFCRENGIQMQAYSPLGKGKLLSEAPAIAQIAERYDVTPAQVVLRWIVQKGVVPVCRSENAVRVIQNNSLGDLFLDADDVAAIDNLESSVGTVRFSGVWTKDHDELRK